MLTIANQYYTLSVDPDHGAKISSLKFRPKDLELLVTSPQISRSLMKDKWPMDFTLADSYGFDEMFPTIDIDDCTVLPWGPVRFPDHGDVWSLPWVCSQSDDMIYSEVIGTSFPYKLQRTVTCKNSGIRLDYVLTNLCATSVSVIWAAHMLFVLCEGTHIELPDELSSFINAYDGGIFGDYGKLIRKQDSLFGRHEKFDMHSGLCGKWYTAQKLRQGWVKVVHPKEKVSTIISFSPQEVPYLGVWINEGGWNDQHALGIEPAKAAMDSPSKARQFGMEHILKGYSTETWSLSISSSCIA
ncbi:MAG: hypothetical protein PHH86_06815 [Sphaerochaetaceae bacterium]|jgi:galactose mutarotase-like enzyme|nr:hypothetical protein [Sphaerochaetaceae bacterium]NLO60676.1 hypothetical protein [Spirochaetales bacterium]